MTILWKIIPTAGRNDPRWLDHPRYEEVVVAAQTPAEARRTAARNLDAAAGGVGNESGHLHSALEDEKLYRVSRWRDGDAGDDDQSPEPAATSDGA